jgi:site-specific recombinase XerD
MNQPKIKVLLRTDKPLSDNTFPIWIRISHLRKSSYISTGYSCLDLEWDSEALRLYESKPRIAVSQRQELNADELKKLKQAYSIIRINPLAKKINSEIDKKIRKIYSTKEKLEASEQRITSKSIKGQLSQERVDYSNKSFIKYFDKQILLIEGKEAFGTLKTYKSILKVLKDEFLKSKDLNFEDIDQNLLESYEAFLRRKGLKKDTIHNHLKTFRAIYYKAIKEELVSQDKNPFFIFKLSKENYKIKDRLSADEIKILKDLELEAGSRLFDTRNLFLFSFYNAGIRIGDLLQLQWANIKKDGRLEYIMNKTGKVKSIKLLPQALDLIKPYKGPQTLPQDFIFPFLNNAINRQNKAYYKRQIESKSALVNKTLKILAERTEIDKNLTSHIARHSFSDIARKKGTSIYDIQSLLGHSDIGTTKRYLESLDFDSQDKAHESVYEGL